MMVKNKVVRLKYYHEDELFYETECGFVFSVPVPNADNAIFLVEDKALLFMRWNCKHLACLDTEWDGSRRQMPMVS